mmetsp:Transcript_5573/g.17580  ORF Transcript_5573/g.17580 Transcript_5573/m.17580 type:complete len:330 (-) Transcript_5573:168-1157(-)
MTPSAKTGAITDTAGSALNVVRCNGHIVLRPQMAADAANGVKILVELRIGQVRIAFHSKQLRLLRGKHREHVLVRRLCPLFVLFVLRRRRRRGHNARDGEGVGDGVQDCVLETEVRLDVVKHHDLRPRWNPGAPERVGDEFQRKRLRFPAGMEALLTAVLRYVDEEGQKMRCHDDHWLLGKVVQQPRQQHIQEQRLADSGVSENQEPALPRLLRAAREHVFHPRPKLRVLAHPDHALLDAGLEAPRPRRRVDELQRRAGGRAGCWNGWRRVRGRPFPGVTEDTVRAKQASESAGDVGSTLGGGDDSRRVVLWCARRSSRSRGVCVFSRR